MREQYWTLCDKSEDCVSKCPYAEHHWYQQQGYIVGSQYICFLPDMEDCPYYQKQQYEKTSAPAQLKSDLEYDEKPVYVTHNKAADRTIIRFKNGSYIELKPTEEKPKRGKRAELPIIDDPMSLDEIGKIPEWTMTINRLKGHLGMCMWCDYHRSNCGCAHRKPDIDEETRECYSIKSTGANQ